MVDGRAEKAAARCAARETPRTFEIWASAEQRAQCVSRDHSWKCPARAACATAVSVGAGKLRHDGQGRESGESLDVVWGLDGVVEVLAHEGEADAADKTDEKSEGDVPRFGGTRRIGGDHGRIDDADIGGLQSGGNAHFLKLGHQTVVESFIGFGFALEDVVLDHALGHRIRFYFLLIEGLHEHCFALRGFAVIDFDVVQGVDIFLLDELVQIFQLGLKAQHLRKIRAVLAQSVVVFLVTAVCRF